MKIVKVLCNFCVLVMEANYCFKINKHISQHDDGEEAICSNIAWEFENVGYQGARSVWTITKVIKVPVNSYTFALVNAVKISWNNENNIFNHKKSKQILKKKRKQQYSTTDAIKVFCAVADTIILFWLHLI